MKNSSRVARNRRDFFRRLPDMELLFLLETAEIEVQRVVSHELGRRRVKGAVPLLINRLSSADHRLRESAADALGVIGDPNAGEALLELFSDTAQPEEIRDTCAYALGRLAFRSALPKLLTGLADPSPTVRSCVVAALSAIGDSKIREAVEIAFVTERNDEVKAAMRGLLEGLPKTSAAKFSLEMFKVENPNARNHLISESGGETRQISYRTPAAHVIRELHAELRLCRDTQMPEWSGPGQRDLFRKEEMLIATPRRWALRSFATSAANRPSN